MLKKYLTLLVLSATLFFTVLMCDSSKNSENGDEGDNTDENGGTTSSSTGYIEGQFDLENLGSELYANWDTIITRSDLINRSDILPTPMPLPSDNLVIGTKILDSNFDTESVFHFKNQGISYSDLYSISAVETDGRFKIEVPKGYEFLLIPFVTKDSSSIFKKKGAVKSEFILEPIGFVSSKTAYDISNILVFSDATSSFMKEGVDTFDMGELTFYDTKNRKLFGANFGKEFVGENNILANVGLKVEILGPSRLFANYINGSGFKMYTYPYEEYNLILYLHPQYVWFVDENLAIIEEKSGDATITITACHNAIFSSSYSYCSDEELIQRCNDPEQAESDSECQNLFSEISLLPDETMRDIVIGAENNGKYLKRKNGSTSDEESLPKKTIAGVIVKDIPIYVEEKIDENMTALSTIVEYESNTMEGLDLKVINNYIAFTKIGNFDESLAVYKYNGSEYTEFTEENGRINSINESETDNILAITRNCDNMAYLAVYNADTGVKLDEISFGDNTQDERIATFNAIFYNGDIFWFVKDGANDALIYKRISYSDGMLTEIESKTILSDADFILRDAFYIGNGLFFAGGYYESTGGVTGTIFDPEEEVHELYPFNLEINPDYPDSFSFSTFSPGGGGYIFACDISKKCSSIEYSGKLVEDFVSSEDSVLDESLYTFKNSYNIGTTTENYIEIYHPSYNEQGELSIVYNVIDVVNSNSIIADKMELPITADMCTFCDSFTTTPYSRNIGEGRVFFTYCDGTSCYVKGIYK